MTSKPCNRDDPPLSSIVAYKGVVITDDRRNTKHDYRDIEDIVPNDEPEGQQ